MILNKTLLSASALLAALASQGQCIPRDGQCQLRWEIEAEIPEDAGPGDLVDLSGAAVSEIFEVRCRLYGDTLLSVRERGAKSWYAVRPGGLWLVGANDRQAQTRLGRGLLWLPEECPAELATADYSAAYEYGPDSSPTRIVRWGLSDAAAAAGGATLEGSLVDDLRLAYDSGLLVRVKDLSGEDDPAYSSPSDYRDGADSQSELEWDSCGRLVSDSNRGLASVSYNRLGLPERISAGRHGTLCTYSTGGALLRRVTTYSFGSAGGGTAAPLSAGSVIQPLAVSRDTVDFLGPFVYAGGALDRAIVDGGFVRRDTAYYFARDHQGSVRQLVRSTDGAAVQEIHYYPYGSPFGECSAMALDRGGEALLSPYRFGGKEQVDMGDLQYLDFGARMHDALLGRFWTQCH